MKYTAALFTICHVAILTESLNSCIQRIFLNNNENIIYLKFRISLRQIH